MINIIQNLCNQDDFWREHPKELEALKRRLIDYERTNPIKNMEKYVRVALEKEKFSIVQKLKEVSISESEIDKKLEQMRTRIYRYLKQLSKTDKFLETEQNIRLVMHIIDQSRAGLLETTDWYQMEIYHIPYAIGEAKKIVDKRQKKITKWQ